MSPKDPKIPHSPRRPNEDASYEVGYGKPPAASRFKPGRSGNPKGRPKGSKKPKPTDVVVEQLKAIVLQEAYRSISIRDGGEMVEMPVIQAALRSLALNAAKGKQRSQRMFFDLTTTIEGERRRDREKLFEAAVDYKICMEKEIALARSKGLPEPAPLPHPDHIIIDPFTGSVATRGPWTEAEKVHWDDMAVLRHEMTVNLEGLDRDLEQAPEEPELLTRKEAITSIIARLDEHLNTERVIVAPTQSG